ncbi:putative disease resistance protein RGA3 [Triticum dicoccoides]|uniref:putative disease resistance protein RGA3 n=1 Tax=Triticum dicoccoides TaxID=85692 RepID=UPI00188F089B|nr:putative disease resistance protein RGA3 [Triticum dicoccoides]
MEETSLEAAIGWLVQAIYAGLLVGGELDGWIRRAGLADDIERLRSEVEGVEMVVSAVKRRAIGNQPLARSLARIRELLYGAEDLVDELHYWRLQQQLELEGGTRHDLDETDAHGSLQVERSTGSSSVGGLRSESWGHFDIEEFVENGGPVKAICKHCRAVVVCTTDKGTPILRKHLKSKSCKKKRGASDPSSTGDATASATSTATDGISSTRNMRGSEVEEPKHGTRSDTYTWDKVTFSNRIKDITHQLQGIRGDVRAALMILGSDSSASSNHHVEHPHRRTSSLVQGKVYGRDYEKAEIIRLIKGHKLSSSVTVLTVLGIGGVGKTTLAQLVYNDPSVESQFDHRIWISVSNKFDETRISREMLDFVSQGTHEGLYSFARLQEVLRGYVKSKRVLLVLDDVWDDMNDCQWNQLLAPFKSDNAKGNIILVTTRKPSVAKRRGTVEPIKLHGLKEDDFWILFKACVFGDENYEVKGSLRTLAWQIIEKLKGNPLAAETAGALLRQHLTSEHWSNILKNEDWKSLQLRRGIMPTLKLCYDQLPYHLQQCFSYCAIFPCNYRFLAEEIVRIWISQGFLKCSHSGMRLDEIGRLYLTNLVNLGFFQQIEGGYSSNNQTTYVMCGLMHDFARVISRAECATLDALQCNEISSTVLHLSIVTGRVYWYDEKFQQILRNTLKKVKNLRSLVLIGQYDSQLFQQVFEKAHNLRLLQVSATAGSHSFLCGLVNPTHLRYLNLQDAHVWPGDLPQVLSKFLHLQVLEVGLCRDTSFTLERMVNLEDCGERLIFPSLERLPFLTTFKLSNLRKIREVSVPSLQELILVEMPELERCTCTSLGDLNSSLRVLEIRSCPALKVFDLFEKGHNFVEQPSLYEGHNYETGWKLWLPGLRVLTVINCPHLLMPCLLPHSTNVSRLHIDGVPTLLKMEGSSTENLEISPNSRSGENSDETVRLDGKILAFHNWGDLKSLSISCCGNLTSISFRSLNQLFSLSDLRIVGCRKLFSSDVRPEVTDEYATGAYRFGLRCLRSLYISSSGITGKWLSLMLQHAQILKELFLNDCPQFTQLQIEEEENSQPNFISAPEASSSWGPDGLLCIPLNLTSSLEKIAISRSPYLRFYGNKEDFAGFTSLQELIIRCCPGLLSSLAHNEGNDVQANRTWLLPQPLGQVVISNYDHKTLSLCFMGNLTCLRKLEVLESPGLESLQLHSCTSLEDLRIRECKQLATVKGMQSLVNLMNLEVQENPSLVSLQLHSCKSLEDLRIEKCESLIALEGLQSLVNLRNLALLNSPGLPPYLERLLGHYELCPRLESLHIDDLSLLNMSLCKGLTCLQCLRLEKLERGGTRLTDEQERALLLLRSLQNLEFQDCLNLVHLPARLHSLPSLKTLMIVCCEDIPRLPKKGLPSSLERLVIYDCSTELRKQCESLTRGKLRVTMND